MLKGESLLLRVILSWDDIPEAFRIADLVRILNCTRWAAMQLVKRLEELNVIKKANWSKHVYVKVIKSRDMFLSILYAKATGSYDKAVKLTKELEKERIKVESGKSKG